MVEGNQPTQDQAPYDPNDEANKAAWAAYYAQQAQEQQESAAPYDPLAPKGSLPPQQRPLSQSQIVQSPRDQQLDSGITEAREVNLTGVYIAQNDGNMVIQVLEPVLIKQSLGDYHAYPIAGSDSLGEIDCQRRFNLFYEFRLALSKRYCGLYIPPLPPKQFQGKSEEITLIERQYFLNLFLKECCEQKYIAQSPELQTFLRPTEDLAKILSKMQIRSTTQDRIALMRATCMVVENYDDTDTRRMYGEIQAFLAEQQQQLQNLQTFRARLKQIVPLKMQERAYYKDFAVFLNRYEESKDKSQKIGDLAHVRLVSGTGGDYLKSKLEGLGAEFQNPIIHISHWVKGELFALDALHQCMGELANTDNLKRKTQADIVKVTEDIAKLNAGKFTWGSMMKSDVEKKTVANQKQQVKAQLELDVLNYDTIKKILTLYLYQQCVPQFKRRSVQRYINAMNSMCDNEMQNSASLQDCWHQFKKLIESYKMV